MRAQYIDPARAIGVERVSLGNPAQPLLDRLATRTPLAVVGVAIRTAADLRDLYGYLIEPAYRRGVALLIASDRELDDVLGAGYIDPIGYPWTTERLRHLADSFRIRHAGDGSPPLTPIEERLLVAMRACGLGPIAQYGIGRFRADFAFPEVRILVECDGRAWHDPERDGRRDAALRRLGWEPLHFTGSAIVADAAACAARVQGVLGKRLALAASEQPAVAIAVQEPWWRRLLTWLQKLLGRQPGAETASVPVGRAGGPRLSAGWLDQLDDAQRAAVQSADGVVQVIAPAGSGKTQVLVARVRELVGRGVPPNRILCCTFNRAAAVELQERLVAAGADGVEATTLHGVGRQILQAAGVLRGKPMVLPYGWWRRLAQQAMTTTPGGVWIEAPVARDQISSLKLGRMLTVDEFDLVATSPFERTLATLYRAYEAALEANDWNDFDDYILLGARLLQERADVRATWQGKFSAVLVDEYQDIEPAQEILVRTLAAPEDLLFCVGDEDQCLYAWRRASVERVVELDGVYPGLERHALTMNYRSPSLVVAASRTLIEHNRRRFPKEIIAARPDPGTITIVSATNLAGQAAHAARLLKDAQRGDAVVLARTSRVLGEVALGLAQAGIRFFGPERIKGRSGEPAVLLAYVRLLAHPRRAREEDVEQAFRVPNRYLPDGLALNLASGLRQGRTFTDAIGRLLIHEDWRRPKLQEAGALLDALAQSTDARDLVHRLRAEGGLDQYYADAERLNPTDQSAIDALDASEAAAGGMRVGEFADALDYQAQIIEQHFDPNGIELATIHGATGRQWPLVIVAGVEVGQLPHERSLINAADAEGELEGERRLAYVAMTRTSGDLVLLHQAGAMSQFITEAAPVAEYVVAAPASPVATRAS